MAMAQAIPTDVKDTLMSVVNELSVDHMKQVLEFALFVKARQTQQLYSNAARPVQRLEDLWADFWPEDESVDNFVDAVRRWRREDLTFEAGCARALQRPLLY